MAITWSTKLKFDDFTAKIGSIKSTRSDSVTSTSLTRTIRSVTMDDTAQFEVVVNKMFDTVLVDFTLEETENLTETQYSVAFNSALNAKET